MIGKIDGKGDEYRADSVLKIKEWGYLDQVVLSMDICRIQDLRSGGGYGYVYMFESFIPMLKKRGITDEDIELMLKENPKKIFSLKN
jgi:phosphotriesterase-related protein